MILYRRATAADAGAICRLVLAAGLDPTSLHWERFVLAVDDQTQRVAGCAQIKHYADCEEFGSLVVRKPYRGQGIGGELLRRLISSAPTELHLVCLSRMQSFYERYGFERISLAASPRTLRIKQRAGRLFGGDVICMRLRDTI